MLKGAIKTITPPVIWKLMQKLNGAGGIAFDGDYVWTMYVIKGSASLIWEGRFKSCLVDTDHYLFALYKYIEMNPVNNQAG